MEEIPGGHGRERRWQAAHEMHSWFASDVTDDPDAQAASDWLQGEGLRRFGVYADAWQRHQREWPVEWRDEAGSSDYLLELSLAQLDDLQAELTRSSNAISTSTPGPTPNGSSTTSTPFRSHRDGPDERPVERPLSAASVRWRYLVLLALRWLPVGLAIPVFILIPLERGLTLTEARDRGVVAGLRRPGPRASRPAASPTPRADAACCSRRPWSRSRRPPSSCSPIPSLPSPWCSRSRASTARPRCGPLEAWYVDATLAADPNARIEGGLSAAGVVLGVSIASGALVSGLLVALDPIAVIDALALPLVIALGIQVAALSRSRC